MSKTPKNKKVNCVIYTLSHPDTNEIRYIGKTVKPLKHRLTDHLYSPKRENNYRTNWINSLVKLGKKPIIKFLDEIEWDKSQKLETYWIHQFKQWGFRLINLTDGGEGTLGRKLSQEVYDAIGKANSKKVYQYDLEGNFIKEWNGCTEAANFLGKNNSKICACARGDRKSAYNFIWSYIKNEKVKKYSKAKVIVTEEQIELRRKLFSKPVLQYDLEMNFIRKWESAKVAAKELKLDYISIIEYLNGKRTKHKSKNKIGEFIWKRK